jgi:hypothetical protein
MKKTLDKIRSKPPEVRLTIAIGLALFCTALIAVGWGMTFSSGSSTPKPKAPSPLTALTGAIKDIVVTPNKDSNTQIIDASNPDTSHDESRPYQAPIEDESTPASVTQ